MQKQRKKIIAISVIIACILFITIFISSPFSKKPPVKRNFEILTTEVEGKKVNNEQDAIKVINKALNNLDFEMKVNENDVLYTTNVDGGKLYKLQQNYKGIPVHNRTIQLFVNQNNECTGFTTNAAKIQDLNCDLEISKKSLIDIISNENKSSDVSISDYHKVIYLDNANNADLGAIVHSSVGNYLINISNKTIVEKLNRLFFDTCYGPNNDYSFNTEKISDKYLMVDTDRNIAVLNAENKDYADFMENHCNVDVPKMVESPDIYFGNTSFEQDKRYDKAIELLNAFQYIYDFYTTTFNNKVEDNLIIIYDDKQGTYNGTNAGAESSSNYSEAVNFDIPLFKKKNTTCYITVGTQIVSDLNTELPTLGHEYTHLVSDKLVHFQQYLSFDTNYLYESEAISEGLSDIFGVIIDSMFHNTDINWEKGLVSRNIANPKKLEYPEKVKDIKVDNKGYVKHKDKDGKVAYTDYAHGASTVISHAAYLMNTGINGKFKAIEREDLMYLWYYTMASLSSDCTFYEVRRNMEIAAKTLCFDNEQRKCITKAFEEVGIEPTYPDQIIINLYDINENIYTDFILKIKDKEFEIGKNENLIIDISDGEYTFKFIDKNNKKNVIKKHVVVNNDTANSTVMNIHSNFGIEKTFNFDETPVLYYNKGYLVKVNGDYGFIDFKGNYIYEPKYEGIYLSSSNGPDDDQLALKGDVNSKYGHFVASEEENVLSIDKKTDGYVTLVNPDTNEIYNKQFKYKNSKDSPLYQIISSDINKYPNSFEIYEDKYTKKFTSRLYTSPYYIYFKDTNTAYGPYNIENAHFRRAIDIKSNKKIETNYANIINCGIGGLFYEHTDNGYVIHNFDDTKKTSRGFEKVIWLSNNSAKVLDNNNNVGIVNRDCDLVIWGNYEDISEPYRGKTFVKENGVWKLKTIRYKKIKHEKVISNSKTFSISNNIDDLLTDSDVSKDNSKLYGEWVIDELMTARNMPDDLNLRFVYGSCLTEQGARINIYENKDMKYYIGCTEGAKGTYYVKDNILYFSGKPYDSSLGNEDNEIIEIVNADGKIRLKMHKNMGDDSFDIYWQQKE